MLDYVILGQGLAGSALALELLDRQKTICVINSTDPNCSSMVAAGLYNPITGRKMVRTWLADKLFPTLVSFYEKAQKKLQSDFFHPIGIYRPLLSTEELNDWMGKSSDSIFQPFIRRVFNQPQGNSHFKDPFGGVDLSYSGYVNVPQYLSSLKNYLIVHKVYEETKVDPSDISITNSYVEVNGLRAKKMILATGVSLIEIAGLHWLPLSPVKGEVLTLRSNLELNTIINRKVFCLPYKYNQLKVGATYDWKNLHLGPTESGKKELVERLSLIMNFEYEIIGHQSGIRPATKSRRPFMGSVNKYGNLFVFGGFGSKGVSMTPFFAKCLIDHLEEGIELPDEVNVSKFLR